MTVGLSLTPVTPHDCDEALRHAGALNRLLRWSQCDADAFREGVTTADGQIHDATDAEAVRADDVRCAEAREALRYFRLLEE